VEAELQKLRIDKSHKARRGERALWPYVLIAVLVIAGGIGLWQWRFASATPVVQTMRVRLPEPATTDSADNDSVVLQSTGYVMAAHKIELASKVIGRVAWVGVEMGDKIEKGQVLVRLEDDEFKARVAQQQGVLDNARAGLAELEAGSRPEEIATARARVDQSEAELANAVSSLERLKTLRDSRAISKQQIDDAESLVRSRKAQLDLQKQQHAMSRIGPRKEQIDAQRATVRQLEGALSLAMIDLGNTVIRAPISATVLQRNVEQGEFVTNGFVGDRGAKGYVLSIADLTDLRVELDISQDDFAKVTARQRCWIVTDAYRDRKYQGVVDLISPEANRQKATVQVRVKVLSPDELLKPDMNATVSFLAPHATTQSSSGAPARRPLRIPATALRSGNSVYVVEGGRARKRTITVSKNANAKDVEVRDGLIGGEDLIINPPDALQDGNKVNTSEASS
jgi:HlyD family secretion protein